MYTQQDLQDVQAQLRRRMLYCLLPAGLMLAGLAYSLVARAQGLTIGLSILLGGWLVFAWEILIVPVKAYRNFLHQAIQGMRRPIAGVFKSVDAQATVRDGVHFLPLILNVGDPSNPEDDRQLYLDANLPLPAWQPGQRLETQTHDKAVVVWKKL